ncbi:MAG: hypothetical protein IKO75_00710 [Bacteroidales bacterium]|nr:hypothetical protein [Bacteroidales bacterium]
MIDVSSSLGKSENLWNNTRIWLEKDIQTLQEGQVTIIPFQEETCTPITFNAAEHTDNQADIVSTKIDNEVKRLMREKTKANLYNALKDAVKHIDNKKDNFIYLISNSSSDEKDREAVNRFIRNWCKIKPANVYVFYIMLTRNAYDKTLVETLKLCPDFFLIDAKGHKMKPICAFMPRELVVNLQDMQDERLELWPFGVMSEQQIHCCYDGSFTLSAKTKDPHFLIQNRIQVANSYGNINIMPKSPKTIEDTLSGQNEYFFDIQLKSEDHEVWIVTKNLHVRVVNKPERILYLPLAWNSELQAQHYPKFLFWKANRPDTLHIYLEDFMNKEARLNNATALFLLSFADIQDADFQLFFNGNERIDKTFTLDSSTLKSRLDIVFSENVRTGSHQLEMRCLSSERLDRINALEPEKLYQSQLIDHQHKHNPLAYLLIISCLLAITIPPSFCLISQKSSK